MPAPRPFNAALLLGGWWWFIGITGCDPTAAAKPQPDRASVPSAPAPGTATITATGVAAQRAASKVVATPQTAARIIAVGDLHGDYQATREVLQLAELIDDEDQWIGAHARLVQVGDFLDRGEGEKQIIRLFERLRLAANKAGGAVYILNGNHELMNAAGRFPYVTPGGFAAFAAHDSGEPSLRIVDKQRRGRWAAFRPGGEYAKKLSHYPIVLTLDGTVFVHGGLLPKHVDYGIDRINRRARDFLLGNDNQAWGWFAAWDSPVNSRHYAAHPGAGDCYLLKKTLSALGAKRMVVGHTVQLAGLSNYCDGQVWAVDVGLSSCCGNQRQALVIDDDHITILGHRATH